MKFESFFTLTKSVLHEQYRTLQDLIPHISYSLKTNPLVGEILAKETDCSFSIHSLGLVDIVSDSSRILFFAQAWTSEEIDELISKGITRFVVDNTADLSVLDEYLTNHSDKRITLFFRMRLKEHTVHTGKHFVFGLYSSAVNSLVKTYKEHPQIVALGIHFHRKTQNVGEWNLVDELTESLEPETINAISSLNIGGGIPISYKNSTVANREYIFNQIRRVHEWAQEHDIEPIIEPGRFLAGPAITLTTTIRNIYENTIIVDSSVFNAAMDTFIAHIRLNIKEEVGSHEGEPYTIKGATPDSMDILRYRVYLKNPQKGDTLTFLNAGAYNFSTSFCALPDIPTRVIE